MALATNEKYLGRADGNPDAPILGAVTGDAANSETDLSEFQGSFALNPRFEPLLDDSIIEYQFTGAPGRKCTDFLDIEDIAAASALRCANKCPDATNPACKGYNAGWDEDNKHALCSTVDAVKDVCKGAYPACVGFDVDALANRLTANAGSDDDQNDGYGGSRFRLCSVVDNNQLSAAVSTRYDGANHPVGTEDDNHDLLLLRPTWSVYSDQTCNLGIGLDIAAHKGKSPDLRGFPGRYNQPDPLVSDAVSAPWLFNAGNTDAIGNGLSGEAEWTENKAYFNPTCNGFRLGTGNKVVTETSETVEGVTTITTTTSYDGRTTDFTSWNPCAGRTGYGSCIGTCDTTGHHYAGVSTDKIPEQNSLYDIHAWTTSLDNIIVTKMDVLEESFHRVDDTYCPHNNFDANSHTEKSGRRIVLNNI